MRLCNLGNHLIILTTMETKKDTQSILAALAYLIDRQKLTPAQIQNLIIKTSDEL